MVAVPAFELDVTEVTVRQYRECVKAQVCVVQNTIRPRWYELDHASKEFSRLTCNFGKANRLAHPMNCVSWDQADLYCFWVQKRLPTEVEWEYAARGPKGHVYPWGDQLPTARLANACGLECIAWSAKQELPVGVGGVVGGIWIWPVTETDFRDYDKWPTTAPVGSYPQGKSPFGVMDLAGNIAEWVSDYWCSSYGPERKCSAARVIRGGSWLSTKRFQLRSANRSSGERMRRESRDPGVGFRCAR